MPTHIKHITLLLNIHVFLSVYEPVPRPVYISLWTCPELKSIGILYMWMALIKECIAQDSSKMPSQPLMPKGSQGMMTGVWSRPARGGPGVKCLRPIYSWCFLTVLWRQSCKIYHSSKHSTLLPFLFDICVIDKKINIEMSKISNS